MLPQRLCQRRNLLLWGQRREISAEQRLSHAVEDELHTPYLLETEPEAAFAHTASLVQPLQEAACQGRLAHTSQTLDKNASRCPPHRSLHLQEGAVPANKTVRILLPPQLLWQLGFARHTLLPHFR